MKKILGWLKSAWRAADGRKRDIGGLFAGGYTAILGYWHIGSDSWIYAACASIAWLLLAVGWAHAGFKGDIRGNGGNQ